MFRKPPVLTSPRKASAAHLERLKREAAFDLREIGRAIEMTAGEVEEYDVVEYAPKSHMFVNELSRVEIGGVVTLVDLIGYDRAGLSVRCTLLARRVVRVWRLK